MKRYYLYGAGINCVGVIRFFGRENVVAVIDSDEKKQGKEIEEIPIVSLQEYIRQNQGEEIIITAFFRGSVIVDFLEQHGIEHYYESPYMQAGFYENAGDIIRKLELTKYPEIVCCTHNPITELIEDELKKILPNITVRYIDREEWEEPDPQTPILITNEKDNEIWRGLNHAAVMENVLDINAIYREKFGYRDEGIIKFKDMHKGGRCFVIGNGPSLTYEDLNRLHKQGEICFGVNRIYLSYEHTEWRPDYYVAVDYIVVRNDHSQIATLPGIKFIRHFQIMEENWEDEDTYEFQGLAYKPGEPKFSSDIYQGIYIGNTVVYDAIQIASYMGFEEIYLLGVDMTAGVQPEREGAHFYKSPNTKENLLRGNVLEARKSLGYAAEVLRKSGKILRNATRGGELEEMPRVDFESLF